MENNNNYREMNNNMNRVNNEVATPEIDAVVVEEVAQVEELPCNNKYKKGAIIGGAVAILSLAGWFGWKKYRERRHKKICEQVANELAAKPTEEKPASSKKKGK